MESFFLPSLREWTANSLSIESHQSEQLSRQGRGHEAPGYIMVRTGNDLRILG